MGSKSDDTGRRVGHLSVLPPVRDALEPENLWSAAAPAPQPRKRRRRPPRAGPAAHLRARARRSGLRSGRSRVADIDVARWFTRAAAGQRELVDAWTVCAPAGHLPPSEAQKPRAAARFSPAGAPAANTHGGRARRRPARPPDLHRVARSQPDRAGADSAVRALTHADPDTGAVLAPRPGSESRHRQRRARVWFRALTRVALIPGRTPGHE